MKIKQKLAQLCLLCAWVPLLMPVVVQAQYDGFEYSNNGKGTCTITNYVGPGGAVTIPATINGLTVIGIETGAALAFSGTGVTSLTIPGSVTSIGVGTFADCSTLTTITVATNNGFYSSVNGVLFNESQNTLIQYPGGLGGGYTIPNSVTNIGESAFAACELTNVIIPDSVTTIAENAFISCSLVNVTIGANVTNIGELAFFGCGSLTSVTIPSSVTNIGQEAFTFCTDLTNITVKAGNSFFSSINGVMFDKNQTTLIEYPGGVSGSYTIPSSITSIEDYAFAYCNSLTSVTIPNSVTSIGDLAFFDCADLSGVYLQGNAPSVGSTVFLNDNSAKAYYLPGTVGWNSSYGGIPTVLWNGPTITSEPQSQMVLATSNVTFTVTPAGATPISYQWYFLNANFQTIAGAYAQTLSGFVYGAVVTNGGSGYTAPPWVQFIGGGGSGASATTTIIDGMVAVITVTNAGSDYTSVPSVVIAPPSGLLIGQTNASLNLTEISADNAGSYYVIISNGFGSVTSSIASLTIAYPPSIAQQPSNQNTVAGSKVYFSVIAAGTQPLDYQWWMLANQQSNAIATPVVINGFVLGVTITSGGAGYLTFPTVQIVGGSGSGAGGYAVVSNQMVTAIIITNAGSDYTTPPMIQIAAPTAISLKGLTSNVLSLDPVNSANAGNYYVVVTNGFGCVTSAMAGLVVGMPPQSFNGISTNNYQLRLQLTGTPNFPYILQSATNLSPPISWQSVLTNPADANGNWSITISNLQSVPFQFFRAVGQ
jgi:hypothetical protein